MVQTKLQDVVDKTAETHELEKLTLCCRIDKIQILNL